MNISMQLCLVLAACICLSESAPDGRLARKQRPTRGFKNVEMMTARGFGKRNPYPASAEKEEIRVTRGTFRPNGKVLIARGYGKRTNGVADMDDVMDAILSSRKKGPDAEEDKTMERVTMDLLVMKMMNDPDFTRSIVRRFIDLNKDDILTLEEMFRNVE